jgi:hypothetical protein
LLCYESVLLQVVEICVVACPRLSLKQPVTSALEFLLFFEAYGLALNLAFTITIGLSHINRKSLTHLFLALAAMNRKSVLLLKVFKRSRMHAKLPPVTLHALRHSGAFADELTTLLDLKIAD